MGMIQLTLSAEEELVRRLEQLAADQQTDVNSFVTRVLELLARQDWAHEPLHPITKNATGLAVTPEQFLAILLATEPSS
jgi:hypothetical protein